MPHGHCVACVPRYHLQPPLDAPRLGLPDDIELTAEEEAELASSMAYQSKIREGTGQPSPRPQKGASASPRVPPNVEEGGKSAVAVASLAEDMSTSSGPNPNRDMGPAFYMAGLTAAELQSELGSSRAIALLCDKELLPGHRPTHLGLTSSPHGLLVFKETTKRRRGRTEERWASSGGRKGARDMIFVSTILAGTGLGYDWTAPTPEDLGVTQVFADLHSADPQVVSAANLKLSKLGPLVSAPVELVIGNMNVVMGKCNPRRQRVSKRSEQKSASTPAAPYPLPTATVPRRWFKPTAQTEAVETDETHSENDIVAAVDSPPREASRAAPYADSVYPVVVCGVRRRYGKILFPVTGQPRGERFHQYNLLVIVRTPEGKSAIAEQSLPVLYHVYPSGSLKKANSTDRPLSDSPARGTLREWAEVKDGVRSPSDRFNDGDGVSSAEPFGRKVAASPTDKAKKRNLRAATSTDTASNNGTRSNSVRKPALRLSLPPGTANKLAAAWYGSPRKYNDSGSSGGGRSGPRNESGYQGRDTSNDFKETGSLDAVSHLTSMAASNTPYSQMLPRAQINQEQMVQGMQQIANHANRHALLQTMDLGRMHHAVSIPGHLQFQQLFQQQLFQQQFPQQHQPHQHQHQHQVVAQAACPSSCLRHQLLGQGGQSWNGFVQCPSGPYQQQQQGVEQQHPQQQQQRPRKKVELSQTKCEAMTSSEDLIASLLAADALIKGNASQAPIGRLEGLAADDGASHGVEFLRTYTDTGLAHQPRRSPPSYMPETMHLDLV